MHGGAQGVHRGCTGGAQGVHRGAQGGSVTLRAAQRQQTGWRGSGAVGRRALTGPSATTRSKSSPPVTSSMTMKSLSREDMTSIRLTMCGCRIWHACERRGVGGGAGDGQFNPNVDFIPCLPNEPACLPASPPTAHDGGKAYTHAGSTHCIGGIGGASTHTCFRMVISRLICSTMPLRTSASLSSTLTATASPVSTCCPYLTLAYVPCGGGRVAAAAAG